MNCWIVDMDSNWNVSVHTDLYDPNTRQSGDPLYLKPNGKMSMRFSRRPVRRVVEIGYFPGRLSHNGRCITGAYLLWLERVIQGIWVFSPSKRPIGTGSESR